MRGGCIKVKTIPKTIKLILTAALTLGTVSSMALADESALSSARESTNCQGLPGYSALKSALTTARGQSNGGFNLDMWAML
jgi:hypothetical protein